MLSTEEVYWAYRNVLGRTPETQEVVQKAISDVNDVGDLIYIFLNSEEFSRRSYRQRGEAFIAAGEYLNKRGVVC